MATAAVFPLNFLEAARKKDARVERNIEKLTEQSLQK